MDIRSLGFRTDLAILRLGGSKVEDRGDHLVVRTDDNPGFWWGNFLLLQDEPQSAAEARRWVEAFRAEFPDRLHRALGIDGTGQDAAASDAFVGQGLVRSDDAVLVTERVRPPPRPAVHAEHRLLSGDADWAQHVELAVACHDKPPREAPEAYRAFVEASGATRRRLTEEGRGVWMGAFVDGRLESQMGLIDAGGGLARYQSVETRPESRGQGLAGTLTYVVGRHGLEVMGAERLVIVADPVYVAIRIYEAVGFERRERQVHWERPPSTGHEVATT